MIRFAADSDFQYGNPLQAEAKRGHVASLLKEGIDFLLVAGDLTNSSRTSGDCCCDRGQNELGDFEQGVLVPLERAGIPVYVGLGNHDLRHTPFQRFLRALLPGVNPVRPLEKWINRRHGGRLYHFEHKGVRFVCLDLYPSANNLQWMKDSVPTDLPVVLFWHYNVDGYHSVHEPTKWWDEKERERAFDFLQRTYDTLAVIVGHSHDTHTYRFRNIPIILTGGDRYAIVEIDTETLDLTVEFAR